NMFAFITTLRVHSVKCADVQLVNDQLMKWHRMKSRVVPWISVGSSHETIAIRERWIHSKLSRERIPFESRAACADDVKTVRRAVHNFGNETCPCPVIEVNEPVRFPWRPAGISRKRQIGCNHINIDRSWSPHSKGCAACEKVRTHRCSRVDVKLRCVVQGL